MKIAEWLYWKKRGLKARLGLKLDTLDPFVPTDAERHDLERGASTDLAKMFYQGGRRPITKWSHYLDIYDRFFSKYRNTDVKMLEIGVFKGGSIDLWREYFGKDATLYGIDIDPECADRVTEPSQVRIGSQDDPDFLRSVVAEMGSPDIILDDGSHVGRHQEASFRTLFPLLKVGGLYIIEDMHTSYWPQHWEGGYRRKGSAVELIKQMIDDIHSPYHSKGEALVSRSDVGGIYIADSTVIIEKVKMGPPRCIEVGFSSAQASPTPGR